MQSNDGLAFLIIALCGVGGGIAIYLLLILVEWILDIFTKGGDA